MILGRVRGYPSPRARADAFTTAIKGGGHDDDDDASVTTMGTAREMLEYAASRWRDGARDESRGVLEHGDSIVARSGGAGSGSGDASSRLASARAHFTRERGDVVGASDACERARKSAESDDDAASSAALWALMASRRRSSEVSWEAIEGGMAKALTRASDDGSDGSRFLALSGARALAALTRFRVEDAMESATRCEEILVGRANALELAKGQPHGWCVATALKTLGHAARLRGENGRAIEMYERAMAYADDVALSEETGAMASRIIAEELRVDCRLALAQALLASDAEATDAAESYAAGAVSAAEALGDDKHPRVGVAVAVSGDVYVAKALRATSGAGELGDGAGVMFAEGLYRNAIKLTHYPRVVEDASAAKTDHEARHLSAVLHARYSSVLRASGEQRKKESETWLESAKLLWPDESENAEGGVDGRTLVADVARKLGSKHTKTVILDTQQMTAITL